MAFWTCALQALSGMVTDSDDAFRFRLDLAQPKSELQVARCRDAVVLRLLQLSRSPGDLLGVPSTRKRDASGQAAIGAARFLLRPGLWNLRSLCRQHRGPGSPEDGGPRRIVGVEHHLHVHRA